MDASGVPADQLGKATLLPGSCRGAGPRPDMNLNRKGKNRRQKKRAGHFPSFWLQLHHLLKSQALENKQPDITAIISQAIRGDLHSYKTLYGIYARPMYNISIRLLNSKEDAEDVLQESFITAFKKLHQLKEAATFGGWFRKIVVNNCLQQLRARISFDDLPPCDELPGDYLDDMEQIPLAEIHFAIRRLPEGCRQIFLLYTGEDLTHKEIARQLQISESTSKSQYLRAKKLLQQQLMKRHG